MTWHIEKSGNRLRTVGLRANGFSDLTVSISNAEQEQPARRMLEILADYQLDEGKAIRAGETVQHGYWVTKLSPGADGNLEVWEMTADAKGFVPGAALTLRHWAEQRLICETVMTEFAPPQPNQLAAVSAGVLENPDILVEGIRYPAPSTASGWFLTTDLYSGRIADMRNEHLYHITSKRPELAKYLALPAGWRFEYGDGEGAVYPDAKQTPRTS